METLLEVWLASVIGSTKNGDVKELVVSEGDIISEVDWSDVSISLNVDGVASVFFISLLISRAPSIVKLNGSIGCPHIGQLKLPVAKDRERKEAKENESLWWQLFEQTL